MNILKEVNELLKKGYSLYDVGINNWAFSKEDALGILNRFEELQISILGGDVYELTNSIVQPNYDNWYCNRLSNETDIEFSKRSIKRAKDYITNYNVSDPSQIFFAFVLDKPDGLDMPKFLPH
jgi:hypothetical protein